MLAQSLTLSSSGRALTSSGLALTSSGLALTSSGLALTSSGLIVLAAALACVVARLLAREAPLAHLVAASPEGGRAAAVRARSLRAAFVRQRDPDAAGHSRPRAPSARPAAA